MRTYRLFWFVMVASIAGACGPSDSETLKQDTLGSRSKDTIDGGRIAQRARRDTGSVLAPPQSGSPATASRSSDPDVAGVEHWRNLDPPRAPTRDADHRYLRNMADYNEGTVEMALYAMDRASRASTIEDARRIHEAHVRLRTELIRMIQSRYEEVLVPVPSPVYEQRLDSLNLSKTSEFDREFYQHCLGHHREWMRKIDDLSASLASPELRAFATQLRANLQSEVDTFTRRLAAVR